MSDTITETSDDAFEQDVLNAEGPVLVDFWAKWCQPCKAIAPILEQLADDYSGKLKICKLDVDSNKKVSAQYGIRGIPTLMVFKNGVMQEQKTGALPKAQLEEFVKSNL